MTMKLLVLIFVLMFAVDSTDNEETISLKQREQGLQKREEEFREHVQTAMQSLENAQNNIDEREKGLQIREESLDKEEEEFREHVQTAMQKLHKIQKSINEREKDLQRREEWLDQKESNLQKGEKRLIAIETPQKSPLNLFPNESFGSDRILYSPSSVKVFGEMETNENYWDQCLEKMESTLYEREQRLVKREKPNVQVKKSKVFKQLNLFPNKSSVQIFRDMETYALSWKDPKHLVPDDKKEEIQSCLQKKGSELSNGLFDCLFNWYFSSEEWPFVMELISAMSEHVDVDKRGKCNRTPLMFTTMFGAEESVANLIEKGAKLEEVDQNGLTALHWAARYGKESCLRVLLQKGADIDAQDKFGSTPLMLAAENKRLDIVKFLLESDADITITNISGSTALNLTNIPQNCKRAIRAHKATLEYNSTHKYSKTPCDSKRVLSYKF